MLVHVVEILRREPYRLHLRFDDGSEGEVDIASLTGFEGVFARLRDPEEFGRVFLDSDWGTVAWPGGLDLAPETLYEHATGRNITHQR